MRRPYLMIPGPIELSDEVRLAAAGPATSHVDPAFIATFGEVLSGMLELFGADTDHQAIVLAGSGTLAMESAVANLIEPGDRVAVVSTGYFGARMADICRRHGAEVDMIEASAAGHGVETAQLAAALAGHKLVTITHSDTSTGVRTDVEGLSKVAKEAGAMVVVDGVCAAAAETMLQSAWGVDVYLTASQKAMGGPAGLALLTVSPAALEAFEARTAPVASYYADWSSWLPIMRAYQNGKPSYFATPAVGLVQALAVSLRHLLDEGPAAVVERHAKASRAVKRALEALGLAQLPDAEVAANSLSCPLYPTGIDASLLGHVKNAGAILAGGLLPGHAHLYFRIGHMGIVSRQEILATISALGSGLESCGREVDLGEALRRAHRAFDA